MRHYLYVILATTLGCLLTGGLLAYATAATAPAAVRLDSETAMAALPDPFSDADLERLIHHQLDGQVEALTSTSSAER